MTRTEKLAEARRLLGLPSFFPEENMRAALRLTLDLIETSEAPQPNVMDAPKGPRCACGKPSRHEVGWCGWCGNFGAALSSTPNFSAMAREWLTEHDPGPRDPEFRITSLERFMRGSMSKPAPAVVSYAGCEHACWTDGKCRSCGRRAEDVAGDLRVARSMLEDKPALAPAVVFDVDEWIESYEVRAVGMNWRDIVGAVVREMQKDRYVGCVIASDAARLALENCCAELLDAKNRLRVVEKRERALKEALQYYADGDDRDWHKDRGDKAIAALAAADEGEAKP